MMGDHCLHAFRIKLAVEKIPFTWFYLVSSLLVGLVPTVTMLFMSFSGSLTREVGNSLFSCWVFGPVWLTSAWYAIFGILGSIFSLMLLVKTLSRRKSTEKFASSSISSLSMFRILFSILLYCFISFASFLPSFIGLFITEISSSATNAIIIFMSYLPPVAGLVLFLMYGLSSMAIKTYKNTFRRKPKPVPLGQINPRNFQSLEFTPRTTNYAASFRSVDF